MTTREEALARFDAIDKKHDKLMEDLEAPFNAIKLLFDVSHEQMLMAIYAAEAKGVRPKKLMLPPIIFVGNAAQKEALEFLSLDAINMSKLGTKGRLRLTFRGLPLEIGDNLEAV